MKRAVKIWIPVVVLLFLLLGVLLWLLRPRGFSSFLPGSAGEITAVHISYMNQQLLDGQQTTYMGTSVLENPEDIQELLALLDAVGYRPDVLRYLFGSIGGYDIKSDDDDGSTVYLTVSYPSQDVALSLNQVRSLEIREAGESRARLYVPVNKEAAKALNAWLRDHTVPAD